MQYPGYTLQAPQLIILLYNKNGFGLSFTRLEA